jgi:Tfp pilus assembly protein PilO
MEKPIQNRKSLIRWVLAVILAADLILIAVNWRLNQSPRVPTSELRRLELIEKSYRADNARLEKFRMELPTDEKEWDKFFDTEFRPAGAGYSAVSEDLGKLSRSAGLASDNITFHQHNPDARGLMQVDISTAVEGDYSSLISFLDKLEHSSNFYVLDSLELASSNQGKIRLNLQLRTFFRTT